MKRSGTTTKHALRAADGAVPRWELAKPPRGQEPCGSLRLLTLATLVSVSWAAGCGRHGGGRAATTPATTSSTATGDQSADPGSASSPAPSGAPAMTPSPRALGAGATFGDLVAATRALDGLGESDSDAGCLLAGGNLAPFRLEAELASAVHPIPDAPVELEGRLDDARAPVVVLTRWAQHGSAGTIALVALSATPPPRDGHLAVLLLTRQGAHLRRTDAGVPAGHAGPFPVGRLGDHLPVVLEGAAGIMLSAEAGLPLSTLRTALASIPQGAPPAILGVALEPGVRLPSAPAPDPSTHGLCAGGVLPAPPPGQRLGSLGTDVLRARLTSMSEGALRCFEFARGDAARGGRMRVLTRIGPEGRVSEACAVSDELGDPTLRACVLGVVRGVVFPAPSDGDFVDVALPIRLVPDTSGQQRPLCDG